MQTTTHGSTDIPWDDLTRRVPVSLRVEGKPVEPIALDESEGGIVHAYPFGLRAVGTKTSAPDAVEWSWRIENRGSAPSPRVTAFFPLHLSLGCVGRHAPVIHGSRGGLDDANFPPESWRQWSQIAVTEGLSWGGFCASSLGGRSSNRDLPFFVVEAADRRGGIFVGIGWSGDWHLRMNRQAERVTIQGGMTNLGLILRPGESFRQPTILLGRYRGSGGDGQRALRRHLRDRVQPLLDGKPMRPVAFWDNYYGDRGQFYEKDAIREIPLAAEAGIDYFVLDGGWNGGGQDGEFNSLLPHIGTWRIAPDKFPGGFALLKNAASRHAMKLGLWFDIERAHRNSEAAIRHPSLFFPEWEGGGCQLLRLGDTQARDWAIETISEQVRALDARWLRLDMNCNPAECWARADAEDRRGETEIRYIENLYKLYEAVANRFPNVAIENCASGGRRIDLELVRRSHTDWISDHSQSEAVIRYHLHGACRWLPCSRLNTSMVHAHLEPNRPVDWRKPLPACAYLSHFGGNFSVSDRLAPLTTEARKELRRHIELFRKTADAFSGECRPLGDQDAVVEGPTGLAAVDPLTGRQAVVLFGVPLPAAATFVPQEFRALAGKDSAGGDAGTDQFVCAYLWHG